MRRLAVAFVSVAALLSAADIAQARDGCGPGRFYNGYRCVPMGGGYYQEGPRYRPAPPPVFYGGGPVYGGPVYGGGPRRGNGMMYIDPNGQPQCRIRGYTVQDGVCKPYRGF